MDEIDERSLSVMFVYAPVRVRVLVLLCLGGKSSFELSQLLGHSYRDIQAKVKELRELGQVASVKRGRRVTWYIGKRGRKWLVSEIERGRAMLFPGAPEK